MTTVALPIEVKVRELDAKLWLALHLARRGARVILGPDHVLGANAPSIGPDVHVLNSGYSIPLYVATIDRVKSVGGRVAVLDTEGGLYRSREAYATRLSPGLLARVDHFLAWGPDPASIVTETMVGRPGPEVVVTGHPTFDLLRAPADEIFSPEADALRREFGRFVLVNTNFGYANPYTRTTVDQRSETLERRQMEELLMERLLAVITGLARMLPDTRIVIRPHPSEDHETYRRAAGGIPNVQVHHRGPVAPWLKACAVLVHNACTTGVEAALLGRPVLAYCPTRYHMEEFSVANGVSERVPDDATLLQRVRDALAMPDDHREPLSEDGHAFLTRYIANVDFSAAERIADVLLRGERPPARRRTQIGTLPVRAIVAILGEGTLDRARAARGRRAATQLAYVRQKFPGLSRAEVERRIDRMAHAAAGLRDVRVRRPVGMEHSVVIEPA